MDNQLIAKISQNLLTRLPGEKAHTKLSPPHRLLPSERKLKELNPKIAAVLALIFPENGQYKTVFIKRQEYKGVHSGQISFPGGKQDESDESLIDTALRETEEEIGVKKNNIQILGPLSRLYIPPSNFLVHPYIGYIDKLPQFNPSEKEVSEIITVDLQKFKEKRAMQTTKINTGKHDILCPCFKIDNNIIWGATAMIVSEMVEISQ
jgi:8-oxo-dGTP pyrophosphatase MutT (NUDIX family)